jgi:tight adherence protein B
MYLWLVLFAAFFVLIAAIAIAILYTLDRSRQAKLEQLLAAVNPDEPRVTTSVFVHAERERGKQLEARLTRVPALARLAAAIRRTGMSWNIAGVLLASFALGASGLFAGSMLGGIFGSGAMPLGALLFGSLPFLYVRRRSSRFLRAFEEQLPDAIDFLARSVRTGNAFSISLEMLVPETAEPLRSSFLRVTRELALGVPLDTALRSLMERVPLLELRFFVAAVLLQRETGGNLGEILARLSSSIRERLRLKAQVKASSAQGRLTAQVLSVLPVFVIVMMNVISPAYTHSMTNDPVGRKILMGAVVSQLIGYLCMRKITDVEV